MPTSLLLMMLALGQGLGGGTARPSLPYLELKAPEDLTSVAASRDGKQVALVGAGEVHLFDPAEGKIRWRRNLTARDGEVFRRYSGVMFRRARFSATGDLLIAQYGGRLIGLKTADGSEVFAFDVEPMRSTCFDISPDGRWAAHCDATAKELILWNVAEQKVTQRFALPAEDLEQMEHLRHVCQAEVRFLPGGEHLLLVYKSRVGTAYRPNNTAIKLFSLPDLKVVHESTVNHWPRCVEVFPDGKSFLAGCVDGLYRATIDGPAINFERVPTPQPSDENVAPRPFTELIDLAVDDGGRVVVLETMRYPLYGIGSRVILGRGWRVFDLEQNQELFGDFAAASGPATYHHQIALVTAKGSPAVVCIGYGPRLYSPPPKKPADKQ